MEKIMCHVIAGKNERAFVGTFAECRGYCWMRWNVSGFIVRPEGYTDVVDDDNGIVAQITTNGI